MRECASTVRSCVALLRINRGDARLMLNSQQLVVSTGRLGGVIDDTVML